MHCLSRPSDATSTQTPLSEACKFSQLFVVSLIQHTAMLLLLLNGTTLLVITVNVGISQIKSLLYCTVPTL